MVPDNRVTVDSFIPAFGEDVTSKFTKGTGIGAMYRALPEQTAGDLAFSAAQTLLAKLNMDKSKIGALLLVTQSPDYRRPATACVLQHRLELPMDCAAVDIGLGCSGFIYGLQTAMSLMESSDVEYCLLLMGETASRLVDPMDKSVAMMYGDAGAAILLERDPSAQTTTLLRSDGSRFRTIILPAGGFRDMNPPHDRFICRDGIERSLYDIHMDGTSVFSFSITDVPEAITDYLAYSGTDTTDYDIFVFHQANEFIIKQLTRKLKLDKEKVPVTLDRFGNTGGISIPLTLCDTYGESTEHQRKKALVCGFGIGLSWGVTSLVIDTDVLFPIQRTSDYYAEGRITPQML